MSLIGAPLRELLDANPRTLLLTVQGVLYGGLTEELWLRWGALSGLVFLVWRLILRRDGVPPAALVWSLAGVVAVLFGLGHLPALGIQAELFPLMVTRVVILNGLVGILYGAVYYLRSLEAAMMAHACTHVAVTFGVLLLGL